MVFSLIVCTYMRPKAIFGLLKSVEEQTVYPNEILIIDASTNNDTKDKLKTYGFKNLKYYQVEEPHKGLTRQRNYGVNKVSASSEILCFLDDDVVLDQNYFKELILTYSQKKDAIAVGGYITNEVLWKPTNQKKIKGNFYYDGWSRKEPLRFKIRSFFKLLPDAPPGFMPSFSHGRSVSFLPPTGKIYKVEQLMGGVASYKKEVFNSFSFSKYFEGYGLYEDADFSLRLSKTGNLYVNTSACLEHYHDGSGRPNKFAYGMMVLRNGWYVWRVKYRNPKSKARIKWHATALLLTVIRLSNVITSPKKRQALSESFGRIIGWFSIIFNPPKLHP